MYKSEIRPSQIEALIKKVKEHNYGKYLLKIDIKKIRGFEDKEICFEFPVTAIIGPNGSGKSSILGAAGCAYKSIKPSMFFPKSAIGDDSMSGWRADYELIDKQTEPKKTIKRVSSFKAAKWDRRDLIDRNTLFFGIERTVPTGEKNQFKQLRNSGYIHDKDLQKLDVQVIKQVGHILGKDFSDYQLTPYGANEKFFVGQTGDTQYSEFHFGAGESSIIRMVYEIEQAPENSIILIEEIENGLHPVATTRMVEYLIDVAERKSVQTIFTTHSDYALLPLPNEAIWACVGGKLHQGKLSVESLRAISGRIDKDLVIFVEDEFAKLWVEAILRKNLTDHFSRLEIHALSGDGNAVKIHNNHLEDPSISSKSICILDGDSQQKEDENKNIFRLPGKMPEREVFDGVYDHIDSDLVKLTVACQLPSSDQEIFKKTLDSVNQTNRDAHLLYVQIGDAMHLTPESTIRGAFFTYWIEHNQSYCEKLTASIRKILEE